MMLDRRHVAGQLLADRGDAVVVSGLGSPTYDVAAVSPSERNFYLWGAMGGAVMTGLGVALAQPGQQATHHLCGKRDSNSERVLWGMD
jgi:thiamine pyrophosphate-dependent acetolactate synthase large subunit-like protein